MVLDVCDVILQVAVSFGEVGVTELAEKIFHLGRDVRWKLHLGKRETALDLGLLF